MVDKKIKVFFPYSSPKKTLLKTFVDEFCRHFPCEPTHDLIDVGGIPEDVCKKWANECDIAIILLTPDLVHNEEKFVRKIEIPILLDRLRSRDNLTLHSVLFEECETNALPDGLKIWLFQQRWGDYPKSMSVAVQKRNEYISFEEVHDNEITRFMRNLANAVRNHKNNESTNIPSISRDLTLNIEETNNSNQNLNLNSQIFQMIEKMQALTKSMEEALRHTSNKELWTLLEIDQPTFTLAPYSYVFCSKFIPICLECKENYEIDLNRQQAKLRLSKIISTFRRSFKDVDNSVSFEMEKMQEFLEITYSQSNSKSGNILTSVDDKLLLSLDKLILHLESIKEDAFRFFKPSSN
jgi:hypothetical protein